MPLDSTVELHVGAPSMLLDPHPLGQSNRPLHYEGPTTGSKLGFYGISNEDPTLNILF